MAKPYMAFYCQSPSALLHLHLLHLPLLHLHLHLHFQGQTFTNNSEICLYTTFTTSTTSTFHGQTLTSNFGRSLSTTSTSSCHSIICHSIVYHSLSLLHLLHLHLHLHLRLLHLHLVSTISNNYFQYYVYLNTINRNTSLLTKVIVLLTSAFLLLLLPLCFCVYFCFFVLDFVL